ncbi:hypothetical protein NQ318_011917 [Aromia moschata]|uniref:Trichohyalin-plectin-homology domain-containing protein n=1 Tax=Aromia moschata TaxID=1265417 RepID=A0AAV8X5X8_9CUCU|nr:hypothetical protein NQ318_011917 [Aromia moschata]
MFGGDLIPPKYTKRCRPQAMKHDIQFPSVHPGYYQHIAREPNTDYHVKQMQFKQRRNADDVLREQGQEPIIQRPSSYQIRQARREGADQEDDRRKGPEKGGGVRTDDREETQETLKIFRLQDLLYEEERQFYYETVDAAQRGDETKMEDMKKRVEALRAEREAERLDVVHQKRIEQYRQRCLEVRPYMVRKHLIETKNAQLQQMRENESKREAERELDRMWHHLNVKDMHAKKEREEQEAISEKRRQQDLKSVWDMQVKGKELLRAEVKRVAEEDRIELEKLAEELKREQIEALDAKRRKRDETDKELREQLEIQRQMLDQRRRARRRWRSRSASSRRWRSRRSGRLRREESALYRENLRQLEEERKREEKELDKLLAEYKAEIDRKQDEASSRCHLSVVEGNVEQIELKRHLAEQELKRRQAENELLRLTYEQNERLQAESDRLEREVIRQYRDDLQRQIEFNNMLRQKERELLEEQMRKGQEEEEKYKKIVQDMMAGRIGAGAKHPFRRVLERYDCHCPPADNK